MQGGEGGQDEMVEGGKKPTTTTTTTTEKPSCAPRKNAADQKEYTCFTDAALLKLRDVWNAKHPAANERIQAEGSKEIWLQLKKNLRSTCSQETCWLKQEIFKNIDDKNLLNFTFSPPAPKTWYRNPTEWLSSLEITNVMKQYEKEYPEFDFIGPSPIDFMVKEYDGKCVWQELCDFDVAKQLKRGKTKVGIIFNTDPHDKSGAHWISLFINLQTTSGAGAGAAPADAPFIFFFDSNGDQPPKEVRAFIDKVKQQALTSTKMTLTEDMNSEFNGHKSFQHQHSNTECGMYSLYLIISLLTKKETHKRYQDFLDRRKMVSDKHMKALRHKLFNFQQPA